MAYVKDLFDVNFLEYASYVIKDRAIPDLIDGLKPVQRRILHTLIEMDNGTMHKVANVVGQAMKYHPHGDASIKDALVVLANKELLIEKQGNYGNIFTGDSAAAGRYIECRLLPFAKQLLYSPEITQYEDSYDGRSKEPVVFPAKIPLVLVLGSEGIAVGMATKILSHNYGEVLEAVKSALRGEAFQLFPDFITGGILDVSEYGDGNGKVLVRAKIEVSADEKNIIIKELPYGTTSESLIASIEGAAKKGKLKLQSISDHTTESANIEIKLARGIYAKDMIDALYAYTDCEVAISVNLLVIKDRLPVNLSVTEVIEYHAAHLKEVLQQELKVEQGKLKDKLHIRTLEQIFIEERIYKKIEAMKTAEAVNNAILKGFEPFKDQIKREITNEDLEHLLKIPIRRISLYDINKARKEIEEIHKRLKEIAYHLKHLVEYAIDQLDRLKSAAPPSLLPRRSTIHSFEQVVVREVAKRNIPLYYDKESGYLGTAVKGGTEILLVSEFDKVLLLEKDKDQDFYQVIKVPQKQFIGKDLLYCGYTDDEVMNKVVFNVLYKNQENQAYLKRFKITQFITNNIYPLVPDGCKLLKLSIKESSLIQLEYVPKPRLKNLQESFKTAEFQVKGVKAAGVRLSTKEIKGAKFVVVKTPEKKEKKK